MAQSMPKPTDGEGYDRIICDVPCTGDGTTRKHPEVFARWEVALALRQLGLGQDPAEGGRVGERGGAELGELELRISISIIQFI